MDPSRKVLISFLCLVATRVAAGAQTLSGTRAGSSPSATSPDPNMPRPIDALESVFLEELTWLEVRDAMRSGKTTVIVASGGVEMNGPYLALGKHNYIPEYYDYPGLTKWLETQGIREIDEGHHDDYGITAIMMTVDPATVRMQQRIARGKFSINGVPLAPADKTIEMGLKAVDYRATITVNAIRKALGP